MYSNTEQIQKFLQDKTKSDIGNILAVSGGEWSQAFSFETNGKRKIIRFSQTDEDFRKDQFAHRFNTAQLPIPRIETIGSVFGGYYAISSKVEGKMIDDLSHEEIQRILPRIFGLFDALRVADVSQTTGYGGWDAQGKGEKDSWKEFLTNVSQDDATSRIDWKPKLKGRLKTYSLFQEVYQHMQQLLGFCPEERHLIHNDLLHFNLLTANNEVVGVIDWGCSLYGDFLYDLAMFDLWQFYYPSMQGIDFPAEAKRYFGQRGVVLSNFEQRLKCYQCHLALDSIKYSAYKDNEENLGLISKRIKEIIN